MKKKEESKKNQSKIIKHNASVSRNQLTKKNSMDESMIEFNNQSQMFKTWGNLGKSLNAAQ